MNSKCIKASVLFISLSGLFIAGCGPQLGHDVQAFDNDGLDVLSKKAQAMADQDGDQENGGCPTGGCPAAGGSEGGCPTGTCEIPPDADTARRVQMPDQVLSEPVKVTPTGERQVATDVVDYHTTRHVWQPSERHHTVEKHRNLVERHFTKVVYHPTFRRINRVVRSGSATSEVMPTEEVVAPPVDYGCSGAEVVPVARPVIVRPIMPYGFLY
ncbi:MAG TPA: hypothetical protein VEL47_01710 [Myxococcota bacterium]|nr:hypothetical protein [Myxococcota bacterium]